MLSTFENNTYADKIVALPDIGNKVFLSPDTKTNFNYVVDSEGAYVVDNDGCYVVTPRY